MSLTIEEIKKALTEKGIALPGSKARKDEYIKLYDEHIVLNNLIGDNYSSDEEGSQSSRKVTSTNSLGKLPTMEQSVDNLTNDELFERLVNLGYNPGPIMDNTRSVYEKKYLQILRGETINKTSSNGFHANEVEISDNEVEIGRSGRRNVSVDRSTRDSPKPSSSATDTQTDNWNVQRQPTRISYIEKIPKGSSQRIIEPIDSEFLSATKTRRRSGDYIGQWSPNIKSYSSTIKKPSQNKSLALYSVIFIFILLLVIVGYQQWSVNDPYKAIEDEAAFEAQEFAARKAEM